MLSDTEADGTQDDIIYPSALPFLSAHLACFAAIWSGVTWQSVVLCASLYWLRIFAIGAGYHRYFSHHAYSTSRAFQFFLAFLSQTSAQKSVLGRQAPAAPLALRYLARRAFAAAPRLYLQSYGVDFRSQVQPDRLRESCRFGSLS